MKRYALLLAAALFACMALAAPANAAFGFKPGKTQVSFLNENGTPATQAGSHPYEMRTAFEMNMIDNGVTERPEGEVRDLTVTMPPGFTGNPYAVPRCSNADFVNRVEARPSCADSSAIGLAALKFAFEEFPVGSEEFLHVPVYNLEPPPGVAAKLGFVVLNVPVTVELTINPHPPYNLEAHSTNIAQAALFSSSILTVWGNPASPAHDAIRGDCLDVITASGSEEPISLGDCPSQAKERAFLTLPRSCQGPLTASFDALAWNTGAQASDTATIEEMQGCGKLGFSPQPEAQPTSSAAESPSGLDFDLQMQTTGFFNPTGLADSDVNKAVVTLPEGMTVNPSQAEGLAACSPAQFDAETAFSPFGSGCPAASKIGTVEVETPALEGELLRGSVFVATPFQNPYNSLIAIYVTIKDADLGINVGLAGKVTPDPRTGQLISTFEGVPEQPVSRFHFHFREGGRSPLVTPPLCGSYVTTAAFSPWSAPSSPATPPIAPFQITSGVGGGPCPPGGLPPFSPGLEAGSLNNAAGAYSPFAMRLTRNDGEQDMTRLSATLAPGVVGKIAGVERCSDAAIAAAKTKSGLAELASPSCPAASQIGRTTAGAGVGPALTFVGGKLYLAGPFGGGPLSIVSVTPAVAGPFDVGTVVLRFALKLNPETGVVSVDGASSDPIPNILAGIPLKLRDLRAITDRPNFTLNPTSCEPKESLATLFGDGLDAFNPADDTSASLSARYQASSCASLAFKPSLKLSMRGGTKRGQHPALTAVIRPRPGDANIGRSVVTLPPSEFIDNAHVKSPCTRVQFNANNCPKASILGTAVARSPLLDRPLEGQIYFRSNGGDRLLPDVVLDLNGEFDVVAVGFVDSKNARIRTTFATVPDAPVSEIVVKLKGGKEGLLINNRDLCKGKLRAKSNLTGQNGRGYVTKPVMKIAGCKGKKR